MLDTASKVFWACVKSPRFWLQIYLLCLVVLLARATSEGARATAELLKGVASFSWPALVALGGWYFRTELRALILRTRKAGLTGVEFVDVLTAQALLKPVAETLAIVAPSATTNPVLLQQATRIREDLNRIEPNDVSLREGRLTSHLAASQLVNKYLRIYMIIFDSQLEALAAAMSINGEVNFQPYYETHSDRHRLQTAGRADAVPVGDFGLWAAFLVDQGLIELAGQNAKITEEGRMFMEYVNSQKLPRFHVL
ncbi:hypothetical protein [Muricoccus radiodurans]|uniref:hypothetical protein n=1 Tax=Muricoccus radiodurans TaxID=2231721 RepID=UPI003CEEF3A1